MKLIKLTDRRGNTSIINTDAIVEISRFEGTSSIIKMDCRAIGTQNNTGVFVESPDQILAMINDDNPFTVEVQYMLALQQICLLADTGSDLHKQTFRDDDITPGWRVAEKMREIAYDVLGKDRPT